MIVVYGTGKSIEKFGPINSLPCKNCKNSNEWFVRKKMSWLSLYFVPIIPFFKYSINCKKCDHVEIISKREFRIYLGFLTLSQEIGNSKPNSNQLKSFNKLEQKLNEINRKKTDKINSDIGRYAKLISEMSDDDLIIRHCIRKGYSVSFLLAVEKEIEKRNLL
jgi:hypothetical protein